jgi:uncharacterized protein (UPF0128 family)
MKEHEIIIYQDSEMQDAIQELRQAEDMFNNATNEYRISEAIHRVEAAKERIQAIRFERGELFVETMVGETQKKDAVQA